MSFLVVGSQIETAASVVVICAADDLEAVRARADFALMGPLAEKRREDVTHYALQVSMSAAEAEEFARGGGGVSVAHGLAPRAHIDAVLVGSGLRKISPVKTIKKDGTP